MITEFYFVEPIDTLSIRGNQMFGDSGAYGVSQFPPKPSTVSGAFRGLIWKESGCDVVTVVNSDFAINGMFLAMAEGDSVTPLWSVPNDIKITSQHDTTEYSIAYVKPKILDSAIKTSIDPLLKMSAILEREQAAKFTQGLLLNGNGIEKYKKGLPIESSDVLAKDQILAVESRVGIELNASTRLTQDGQLFTVEHTVLKQSEMDGSAKGLLVGINQQHESIGESGYLRLGGDGRVARYKRLAQDFNWLFARPDTEQFKLTLISPAIFKHGWLPNDVIEKNGEYWLEIDGFTAQLVSASISRADVVSGWDIDQWKPKVAERVVPEGSVYWFDGAQGDWANLEKYVRNGMGLLNNIESKSRWVEGYNRAIIANWNK